MTVDRFSCVLFDMDGTLVDTAPGITATISFTLEQIHWPPEDPATLLLHAGPPLHEGFQTVSGMSSEQADRATRIYRARYDAVGAAMSSLFSGIEETLRMLHERGVPLGVATSKIESTARPMLERFGIADYFSAITGASPDESRSSKADVVRECLRRLSEAGADVSKPVLIGDRHYDVDGAAEVGVPTIGALWGYAADRDELRGAVALIQQPHELQRLLWAGSSSTE